VKLQCYVFAARVSTWSQQSAKSDFDQESA
jgi:hypothetical protein